MIQMVQKVMVQKESTMIPVHRSQGGVKVL